MERRILPIKKSKTTKIKQKIYKIRKTIFDFILFTTASGILYFFGETISNKFISQLPKEQFSWENAIRQMHEQYSLL